MEVVSLITFKTDDVVFGFVLFHADGALVAENKSRRVVNMLCEVVSMTNVVSRTVKILKWFIKIGSSVALL